MDAPIDALKERDLAILESQEGLYAMRTLVMMCIILNALIVSSTAVAADERPLLRNYRGKVILPDALYQTYSKLVKAMKECKENEIRRYCLPFAVEITRESRPNKWQEYGQDINLPYLKSGFTKEIEAVRKERDGCYLIRTQSSYLFFVETKESGWKLYRYGDKPID